MLSDDILISSGPSIVIMLPHTMAERINRFPLRRSVKLTLLVAFWFIVAVAIIFEAWLKICFIFILKSCRNCYWELGMDKPQKKLGSQQLCETVKTKENHKAYTKTSYQDFIIFISGMNATTYKIVF